MLGNSGTSQPSVVHGVLTDTLPLVPVIQRFRATQQLNAHTLAYLGVLIYAAQLLGFVFNPHIAWGSLIKGLDTALFATHMPVYDAVFASSANTTPLHVFVWISVAVLASTIFFAVAVAPDRGSSSAQGNSETAPNGGGGASGAGGGNGQTTSESLILGFTATVVRSASTWLIVPFAHWAFASWTCRSGFVADSTRYSSGPVDCYGGEHAALIAGTILLVVLAAPIVFTATAVDVDTASLSSHPRARAHVGIDQLIVAQLVVLTALFHVATTLSVIPLIGGSVTVVCALMAAAVAMKLPFYLHSMNRALVAINTCAASVGAVAFFAGFESVASGYQGRLPTTLALAVVPPAFLVGWCFADVRLSSRWSQLLEACDSSLTVETDAADEAYEDGESAVPGDDRSTDFEFKPTMTIHGLDDHVRWSTTSVERASAGIDAMAASARFGDGGAPPGDGADEEEYSVGIADSETGSSVASSVGGAPVGPDPDAQRNRRQEIQALVSRGGARIKPCDAAPYVCSVFWDTDVELATRFVTAYRRRFSLPAPNLLRTAAANVFNRGFARFPRSALLPIHFGAHVATSDPSRCLCALGLIEAVPARAPSLHQMVRFGELKRQLRAALGILDHAYEREMGLAADLHTEALRRLHAFWLKLMEPSVDLASAAEVADDLHAVRTDAFRRFRNALEAQRGSLDAEYASKLGTFVKDVLLDHNASAECDAVATELTKRGNVRKRSAVDAEMATRVARLSAVIGDDDGTGNSSGAGSGGGERGGSRKTYLLQHMAGIFAFLVLCVAVLLGTSVISMDVDAAFVDRAVAANQLRLLPLKGAFIIGKYRQLQSTPSAALQAAFEKDLLGHIDQLEVAMRTVTQDDRAVSRYLLGSSTRGRLAEASTLVPDAASAGRPRHVGTALRDYDAVSFWSSLAGSIAELRRVAVGVNASGSLASVDEAAQHVYEHLTSISQEGMSRELRWWLQEHASATEVATAIVSSVVLVALATTMLAVTAFVHNFSRAAETKFLTFQLFTLIPFDSLELLATAAKARIDGREAVKKAGAATDNLSETASGAPKEGETPEEDRASGGESEDTDLFNMPTVNADGTMMIDRRAESNDSGARKESSVSTGTRRRSATRKSTKAVDPKSWRGMLTNAIARNGPPKSILKMTFYGVDDAEDGGTSPVNTKAKTGPRITLNPDVTVVEAPETDAGPGGAAALTGKAALSMLTAMQSAEKDDSAADVDVSASISHAEKTGELDADALRAGDVWRREHNVHPTRVVGGASGPSAAGFGSRGRDGASWAGRADLWCRGLSVVATLVAVIAFAFAAASVIEAEGDAFYLRAIQDAGLAVSHEMAERSAYAAVYAAAPSTAVSFDKAVSSRSHLCGDAMIAGPLLNFTYGRGLIEPVRRFAGLATRTLRVQRDAVRLVELGRFGQFAATSERSSYALQSLRNATVILAQHADADPVVRDTLTATNVRIQSGAQQPDQDLGRVLAAAGKQLLVSPRAVQLATDAVRALSDAVAGLSTAACSRADRVHDTTTAIDVARWSATAALSMQLISLVARFGSKGRLGTLPLLVWLALAGMTATYLAVGELQHAYVRDVEASCALNDRIVTGSELADLTSVLARAAAVSGRPSAVVAFKEIAAIDATASVSYSLRDVTESLQPFVAESLTRALQYASATHRRLRQLGSIAACLTVEAMRSGTVNLVPANGLGVSRTVTNQAFGDAADAFASHVTWNSVSDPALAFDALTQSSSVTLVNRSFDLGRWNSQQRYDAAVAVSHNTRFAAVSSDAQSSWHALVSGASEAFGAVVEGAYQRLALATYFGIAFTALATIMSLAVVVPSIVKHARGKASDSHSDDKQSSAMERIRSAPAFQRALRQSYVTVALVTVLLLAILASGLYAVRANSRVTEQLEASGLRSVLVAQSYAHVLRDGITIDAVDAAACAIRTAEALVDNERELWFKHDHSVAALRAFKGNDELSFGTSDPDPYTTDAWAYTETQCGVRSTPTSSPSYGPFAELPDMSLHTGIREWTQFLRTHFDASTSYAKKASIKVELSSLVVQLIRTTNAADDSIREDAHDRVAAATLALQVLCGLTIALVLLLFQALVIPVSKELTRVQEDTLLMLQVVPPDVRDLVPAITEYLETGTMDTAAEIRRKLEMNESLLKNILPEAISRRLKSGESPIADMHPDITIVFTDFVGFTSISSGLSAEEIVDFLNEVFVEFDLITELLKLDKIKTIGDAYFMTGGLDPSVTDHAMRVIEASIFMFEALGEHNGRHRDRKPLRMRLGVHTGPAVAGVIGTKKVAYDLWGPSVAIANAMESTGVPGFIHVSESAVAQTRGYYSFEPRGELPKEKGVPDPMPNTFLYKGRLVPTPYQFMRRPRNEPRQIAATPKKD